MYVKIVKSATLAPLAQVFLGIEAALTASTWISDFQDASTRTAAGELQQILFHVRVSQDAGDDRMRVLWEAAKSEVWVEALRLLPPLDRLLHHTLANAVNAQRPRAHVFLTDAARGAFAFARGDIDELDELVAAVHESATQLYDMAVGADLALGRAAG